jgi:hypothetical protein
MNMKMNASNRNVLATVKKKARKRTNIKRASNPAEFEAEEQLIERHFKSNEEERPHKKSKGADEEW